MSRKDGSLFDMSDEALGELVEGLETGDTAIPEATEDVVEDTAETMSVSSDAEDAPLSSDAEEAVVEETEEPSVEAEITEDASVDGAPEVSDLDTSAGDGSEVSVDEVSEEAEVEAVETTPPEEVAVEETTVEVPSLDELLGDDAPGEEDVPTTESGAAEEISLDELLDAEVPEAAVEATAEETAGDGMPSLDDLLDAAVPFADDVPTETASAGGELSLDDLLDVELPEEIPMAEAAKEGGSIGALLDVDEPLEEATTAEEAPIAASEESEAVETTEGTTEAVVEAETLSDEDFLLEEIVYDEELDSVSTETSSDSAEGVVVLGSAEEAEGVEVEDMADEESISTEESVETTESTSGGTGSGTVIVADESTLSPDYNTRHMRRERSGYAGTFRLANGERVLSMYRALKGKGVGGRVYLTNRRFLVESSLHTELPITKVAGISTGKFSRVRGLKLFLGILFLIICAAAIVAISVPMDFLDLSFMEDMAWLSYVIYVVAGILGLIGLIMFFTSISRRFVLTIFTEGVEQAFSVRSGASKGDVTLYQPIAFGKPGRDYKQFCSQVGARLVEIKQVVRR